MESHDGLRTEVKRHSIKDRNSLSQNCSKRTHIYVANDIERKNISQNDRKFLESEKLPNNETIYQKSFLHLSLQDADETTQNTK